MKYQTIQAVGMDVTIHRYDNLKGASICIEARMGRSFIRKWCKPRELSLIQNMVTFEKDGDLISLALTPERVAELRAWLYGEVAS